MAVVGDASARALVLRRRLRLWTWIFIGFVPAFLCHRWAGELEARP